VAFWVATAKHSRGLGNAGGQAIPCSAGETCRPVSSFITPPDAGAIETEVPPPAYRITYVSVAT
jgi:hypothetical protein